MSYKEKIKPLFFLFSLFFTGLFLTVSIAGATWTAESFETYLELHGAYYDSNDKLVFEFSHNDAGGIMFPQADYTWTSVQYSKASPITEAYFTNWDCPTLESYYFAPANVYLLRSSDGTVSCKPKTMYILYLNGSYLNQNITNSTGITKNEIDNYLGTNSLETNLLASTCRIPQYYWTYGDYPTVQNVGSAGMPNSSTSTGDFPFYSAINGSCGSADGSTQDESFDTDNACLTGNLTDLDFDFGNLVYTWTCEGTGGGSDDYCSADYSPSPASCGSDDGQTVSDVENYCTFGSLVYPSFVETITGWTWTCQSGNTYDYCSAIRGTATPPEVPTDEDCSSQTIPDKWLCQISNAVRGAFLPSPSKLNSLNTTINLIGQKFPFNYITTATESLKDISITETTPTFSLMGNSGTINLLAVDDLMENVKNATSILIIIMFLFWLLGYIKHFFR